jgi:hypothetical protein
MQYTTQPERLLAFSHPGMASDAALAQLAHDIGPVVAVRLVLPATEGGCGCSSSIGSGPDLVALDPADTTVPTVERDAVGRVGPGLAVVDRAWSFLLGGTIAFAGLDVVVRHVAPLTDASSTGPILVSLADLVASLGNTMAEHAPELRTVVVVRGADARAAAPAWHREPSDLDAVSVMTGVPADRCAHAFTAGVHA